MALTATKSTAMPLQAPYLIFVHIFYTDKFLDLEILLSKCVYLQWKKHFDKPNFTQISMFCQLTYLAKNMLIAEAKNIQQILIINSYKY